MKTIDSPSREAPIALLVGLGETAAKAWEEALETTGWAIRRAADTPECCTMADQEPIALLLLQKCAQVEAAAGLVTAVRALHGPSRTAPIVLLTEAEAKTDPKSSSVDAAIPIHCPADHAARELERWRPVSLEPTRRIAGILGPGPIAGMIERLGVRLEAAMGMLAQERIDQGEAHRLAGLCGTLGFAQAHAAWLDLSLGEATSLAEARRTTRLTLAAIARGL